MTTHPPKISVTNTPTNFTKSLVIIIKRIVGTNQR